MLVMARKEGEEIFIGDDIKITVTSVRGNKVKIGVEAPAGLPVHRREVFEAIQLKKREEESGGRR